MKFTGTSEKKALKAKKCSTSQGAAEQKARATYEHLMSMTGNEQILEPLYFLREREVVHFQRFGECLEIIQGIYNGRSSRSCRNARRRRP